MKKIKSVLSIVLTALLIISSLVVPTMAASSVASLTLADINGGSTGDVTQDLTLPNGFTWTSNNPDLVSNDGKILTYDVEKKLPASITASDDGGNTKTIDFNIAYGVSDEPRVSDSENVYWQENFNDSENVTATWEILNNVEGYATQTVENGAFKGVTLASSGAEIRHRILAADKGCGQTTKGTVVSFEFSILENVTFNMVLGSAGNADSSSQMTLSYNGSKLYLTSGNSESYTFSQSFVQGKTYRVTIEHNFAEGFSFWLNGEKASNTTYLSNSNKVWSKMIKLTGKKNSQMTVIIDNISVFAKGESKAPLSDITLGTINGGANSATQNISLPTAGGVSWKSLDESVIEISGETGIVHRSKGTDLTGTVVASVVIDGVTYQKTFTLTVPVNTEPVPTTNNSGEAQYVVNEDFSNADSCAVTAIKGNGYEDYETVEVTDGALKLTTTAGATSTPVYLVKVADASYTKQTEDRTTLSFDFKTQNKVNLGLQIGDSNSSRFCELAAGGSQWTLKGGNSTSYVFKQAYEANTTYNAVIQIDFTSKTFKFWLNGEKAVLNTGTESETEDVPFWTSTYKNLTSTFIRFWVQKNSAAACQIDNVKIFKADYTPQELVGGVMSEIGELADIATFDTESTEQHATAFGVNNKNGCSVTFTTPVSGLVNADGTVNYGSSPRTTEVTVTAEKEGYKESKTFNVTVAGNFKITEYKYPEALSEEGEDFEIAVTLRDAAKAGEVIVLVGVYDKDDNLIAASVSQKVNFEASDTSLIGTLPKLDEVPSSATVKTFIWMADTMQPVAGVSDKVFTNPKTQVRG